MDTRPGKRAKTRLRRLVEANNLHTMVSVTFDTGELPKVRRRDLRGDLSDWETARHHFSLFMARVKRKCKGLHVDCRLIGVEELQKRGIQHFHFATDLPFSHAEWLKLWGYGTVWLSGGRAARRREGKRPGSEASYNAYYMSKYLGKEMVAKGIEQAEGSSRRGFHQARYFRSRSLSLPFEEHLIEPGDLTAFEACLEVGGFALEAPPRPIEQDGMALGWWARSVQTARQMGDLSPEGMPGGGRCELASSDRPREHRGEVAHHLTNGQLSRIAQPKPPKDTPVGSKKRKISYHPTSWKEAGLSARQVGWKEVRRQ